MSLMLCKSATIEEAKRLTERGEWYVEQKYDGVRGMISNGKLYNRRGVDMSHKFPEFEGLDKLTGNFDGEVVASTGEFNDVSGRVHMKDKFLIKMAAKSNPAIFVAFDTMDTTLPIELRRAKLVEQARGIKWLEVAPQKSGEFFNDMWEQVVNERQEGVVIKRPRSKYEGKRSHSWLKVKAFIEEIVEFNKFEEHPKGITLETDDGRRVVVNGHQAKAVREKLEREGKVKAEIQYLPQKDSSAWRFPSFRGLSK